MRRLMELFADLERRRACLPWSGTWIASRRWSVFLRLRSGVVIFCKPGQETTTEQIIREPIDLGKLSRPRIGSFGLSREEKAIRNRKSGGATKKGMGIAAFLHGAGFTGSGERYLSSVVGVEGCADGSVRVLVSSTEFGQGTKTVLSQIAAEALGLPYENVSMAQPDTLEVPNSGPTVASRTVMVVGKLVQSAALGIEQTLISAGLLANLIRRMNFAPLAEAMLRRTASFVPGRATKRRAAFSGMIRAYRGEAYAAFAWAVYIAEVAVDLTTYSVSVNDFVALQEVGKVLHPLLARGQIIGGVAQGIGFSLYEKVVWQNGRMQNGQMTNYIMPTSSDLPPIRVFFEELGNVYGAYGAKGIGELPMDGPAPAIVNAVGRRSRSSFRFDSSAAGRYS